MVVEKLMMARKRAVLARELTVLSNRSRELRIERPVLGKQGFQIARRERQSTDHATTTVNQCIWGREGGWLTDLNVRGEDSGKDRWSPRWSARGVNRLNLQSPVRESHSEEHQ